MTDANRHVPQMVLMVPLRRCGSNALRLRLNLNPYFYSPYPLHLTDLMATMDVVKAYGDLEDDNNYFRMVVDVIGLQSCSLIRWPCDDSLDPIDVLEAIREKRPRNLHQIHGELLQRAARKRGAWIVMDKSQDSVADYETLLETFPHMLFLDIVRDPRAQIASMNRAIIYDFDTVLNTIRWVEGRRWVDKIRARCPNQILTVRFEDFIEDQESVLRQIGKFIGLPFHARSLDISQSDEATRMSSLSPLWETNASPPLPQIATRYLTTLSMTEIEHIEALTLSWMERYNYTPITPHTTLLPLTIDMARARSEEKKRLAWLDLERHHPRDYCMRRTRARYLRSLSS